MEVSNLANESVQLTELVVVSLMHINFACFDITMLDWGSLKWLVSTPALSQQSREQDQWCQNDNLKIEIAEELRKFSHFYQKIPMIIIKVKHHISDHYQHFI